MPFCIPYNIHWFFVYSVASNEPTCHRLRIYDRFIIFHFHCRARILHEANGLALYHLLSARNMCNFCVFPSTHAVFYVQPLFQIYIHFTRKDLDDRSTFMLHMLNISQNPQYFLIFVHVHYICLAFGIFFRLSWSVHIHYSIASY